MKTVREILVESRALIADPRKWTQRAYGRETPDGRTAAYCSSGAILKITGLYPSPLRHTVNHIARVSAADAAERHLAKYMGCSVPGYNDSRPHATVLARWDAAIAALPEPLMVPEVEPSVRRARELVPT